MAFANGASFALGVVGSAVFLICWLAIAAKSASYRKACPRDWWLSMSGFTTIMFGGLSDKDSGIQALATTFRLSYIVALAGMLGALFV